MGNHWCDSPRFIPRFMKGLFNSIPPVPRYVWSWAVSYVVEYLKTLFPLESLDLKTLTLTLKAPRKIMYLKMLSAKVVAANNCLALLTNQV